MWLSASAAALATDSDEVVCTRAYTNGGAAFSVFKVTDAGITSWLENPRTGLTNWWLNPVGFRVFDAAGKLEVAYPEAAY
jgi:hypothetical protein